MHPPIGSRRRYISAGVVVLAVFALAGLAAVPVMADAEPVQVAGLFDRIGKSVGKLFGGGDDGGGIAGAKSRSIDVAGEKRHYLIAPPPAGSTEPLPLVLVFHGGGGSAKGIATTTLMHELGAANGFIVVYPFGTGKRNNMGGTWNAGGRPPQGSAENNGIDDIAFIRALLAEVSRDYPVDPRRIYAAGLSKGGMIAYHLACRMSETFAAVAAVASTLTSADCDPAVPVSILHIHGTGDENVPIEGGKGDHSARDSNWPPVHDGLNLWRRVDGCQATQEETYRGPDTICRQFTGCRGNTAVRYCEVDKGGHAWPGSIPKKRQKSNDIYVSQKFPATDVVWKFFVAHPKP